jgi:hypothetical protein
MPPHVRFGKAGLGKARFRKRGYRTLGLEKQNVGQPIFAMWDVENLVLGGRTGKTYTYDLRTTLAVRGAGGCLTAKKGAWCGAVLVRCGAVFVDLFHFCYFFYYS